MPCIGIDCDIRKEKVSFFECSICDRCNKFPSLLKKKFLFPSIRSGKPRVSVSYLTSCPRQAYLKMTKNFYMGRSGIIATNIGSALHEYLKGISDISEKFIRWTTPEGHECVGYLDALSISKRILYELKTTAHGWNIRDYGAKNQHILQLNIYATILKKMHGVDLHALKLVYIGLGDKDCIEIDVPFEDKTDFINQKTTLLKKHIDDGTIPKGEPMWPEWECGYCPFSDDCTEKVTPERTTPKKKTEAQTEPQKEEPEPQSEESQSEEQQKDESEPTTKEPEPAESESTKEEDAEEQPEEEAKEPEQQKEPESVPEDEHKEPEKSEDVPEEPAEPTEPKPKEKTERQVTF